MKPGLLLAVCFMICGGSVFECMAAPPHDGSDGRCLDCHVRIPLEREPMSFYSDIPSLCRVCHENFPCGVAGDTDKGYVHPVNVAPSMKIPDDLQLDELGLVSCITCHYYHDKNRFGEAASSKYLRRSSVKRLCLSCHGDLADRR